MSVSELFPHVAPARGRPLLRQLACAGSNSRHGGALLEAAHRQRHLRAAEHGLVDHLRTGHRERRTCPASSPSARRRATAARTTRARHSCPAPYAGHADRHRGRPGARRARFRSSRTPKLPRRHPAHGARLLAADESRATGHRRARTRRSKAASSRSSWRSACRPRRPSLQDISGESAATRKLYGIDNRGDRGLRPAVPDGAAAFRSAACASCR